MSDIKSKLPDLKELGSMSYKLFSGIKNTVDEIITDYKAKRATEQTMTSEASKEQASSNSADTVEKEHK